MGGFAVSLFCYLSLGLHARYIRSSAVLYSEDHSVMIAGFGLGPGEGRWDLRVKLVNAEKHSGPFQFALMGFRSDFPPSDFSCAAKNSTNLQLVPFQLPSDFVYTPTLEAQMPAQSQAVHWTFYLLDCEQTQSPIKVRFTFIIKGAQDVPVSIEEISLEDVYLCLAILYTFALLYALYLFLMSMMSDQGEETEGILIFQAFSLILQLIGLVFAFIHYSRASDDGRGWVLFRFFGQILELAGELCILISMLCVSNGLLLPSKTVPSMQWVSIPSLACCLTFVSLVMFEQVWETTDLKSLNMQGVRGHLDVALRVAMLGWNLRLSMTSVQFQSVHAQVEMKKVRKASAVAFTAPLLAAGFSLFRLPEDRLRTFLVLSRLMFLGAEVCFLRILASVSQPSPGKTDVLPSSKPHIK